MAGDSPLWMAISAIKAGLSANRGLAAAREAGLGVQRASWLKLYAEVKTSLAGQAGEMTAPLNRRPLSSEIFTMSTKAQEGYLQQVEVDVRDRASGEILVRPYSVRGDSLISRGDAVDTAIDSFSTHADAYGEQILGAAYTGTYLLAPGLE
jgi:hypothetical protein